MLIFLFFDILRFAEAPDPPKSLKNTDDDSGSSFEELGIVFLSCDEGTSAKNVESEDPKSEDGIKQQKCKKKENLTKSRQNQEIKLVKIQRHLKKSSKNKGRNHH